MLSALGCALQHPDISGRMAVAEQKKEGNAKLVTAPGALVLAIDAEHMKQRMDECIRKTGKVTFGIREVSVTKLGEMTDAFVIVN